MEEEPLMNLRPKTPEELLIWVELDKKELIEKTNNLQVIIKLLKEEISEFKTSMKQTELGGLILKNKSLKELLKLKELKIKHLEEENSMYLQKIIRLQKP